MHACSHLSELLGTSSVLTVCLDGNRLVIRLCFLWSTLLIKKLHFYGERFLTGCGLNPCCVLPSLVLASEHRRQTTKGIKYFPLDREPRAQP